MAALLVVVEHYWQGPVFRRWWARDTPPGPMMLALLAVVGLSGLFVIAETMMSLISLGNRSTFGCPLPSSPVSVCHKRTKRPRLPK